jgi:4-hydroxy-tetrahydrodipicolinate synthase
LPSIRPPSTFVISLTPFTDDGSLDENGLRRHLRRVREAGIGVYLGGSGSGEGYTLLPGEVARVLEIGAEELGGRVPVRAMGVEPRTSGQMIELGRLAQAAGLDGTQIYSLDVGHGNRPRPAELERYFCDVLDAVGVPAVVSSHFAAGYFVPVEVLGRLLDRFDHLVGVNCTNPDVTYLVRVLEVVDGRADVHVGGPMQALTCLALGGQGYLSSEGNVAPSLCVDVIERWAAGDLDGCASAFAALLRLFTATREAGGIAAAKAALNRLGLPGGYPRLPRLPVTGAALDALVEVARSIGLGEEATGAAGAG